MVSKTKQDCYIGIKIDRATELKLEEYAKKTYRTKSGVVKLALTDLFGED